MKINGDLIINDNGTDLCMLKDLKKEIKLLNKVISVNVVAGSTYRYGSLDDVQRFAIDLTQYDWFPEKLITILPSQAVKSDYGFYRGPVMPHYDFPTTRVEGFVPQTRNL